MRPDNFRFWILDLGLAGIIALLISGCASAVTGGLLSRDFDSALTLARAYGTEEEIRCFEALKSVVDRQEQIDRTDTDGIISMTYRAWLLRHYGEQARNGALKACMPVAAGIGLHVLTR